MSARESVSVVVPHYGPADMTERLCDQLLRQEGVDLQVIVVDDHSPTPPREVEGVQLVRRGENGGFGSAVNAGASAATGDLLLILNSDVSMQPTAIAELVAAARAWQPCVAAPALLAPDGSAQPTRHRWPSAWRSALSVMRPLPHLLKVPFVRGWLLETRPPVTGAPTPADWVSGAVLLVPLAEFRREGGFNESFFMFGEDVDLQRRLHDRGIPSLMFQSVEMVHVGGASTDAIRARNWSLRARWVYAETHGFARRLRMLLWGTALLNAVWNLAARAARKDVNVGREFRHDVGRALGRTY